MQYNQNNAIDHRRAARHRARYPTLLEHLKLGDMQAVMTNISANGFMVEECPGLSRGDRINVRLPEVGMLEAYVIWTIEDRAGFQLERIIPLPDFMKMLDTLQGRAANARRPGRVPFIRS